MGQAGERGGIGGQQSRILAPVGDVCLIRGRAPDAHFGEAHHHFQHIHVADDVYQLGRSTSGDETAQLALAFNGMTDALQKARHDLELKLYETESKYKAEIANTQRHNTQKRNKENQ